MNGYQEISRLLIEEEADANSRDRNEWTPLLANAHSGNEAVIKLLLKVGADPNGQGYKGQTPLHRVAIMGHDVVIRLLLNAEADIEAKEDRADMVATALQSACMFHGNMGAKKLLLETNADVNYQEVNGKTALHWGVGYDQVEVPKLLLEAGADVTIRDADGKTVLHFAVAGMESPQINKLLLKYGADINAKSSYGC